MFGVIKSDLERLEEELLQYMASPVPLVTEIGTHLVNSGGKRLRPALCLLAAHGGPSFDLALTLPLAASLEMIHMASLVHDDVIDKAGTRRGTPTANAKWGNKISILSGDFIFAKAFRLVADSRYNYCIVQRLAELICNLSTGEIIQDKEVYHASRDVDEYYNRISMKTADFLAIACEVGGIVSGMAGEAIDCLRVYGHSIGMAFQLTDDLLDIMSTTEGIGKPVGNDIRQGIATLPTIYALNISPDRGELENILTNRAMTDGMVERALAIVRESGGIEMTQSKAQEFLDKAKDILPRDLSQDVYDTFIWVADFIGEREF